MTDGRLELWIPGASMGVVVPGGPPSEQQTPLQNFRQNPVKLTAKLTLSPNLPRRRRRRRPLVVCRRELLR